MASTSNFTALLLNSSTMATNNRSGHGWNSSFVPAGCTPIETGGFVPWNNPDNVVSFETEDIVRKLKDLLFLPIFFFIGFPANIINMVIFYKQGIKERINVLLFALSLADALHLLQNILLHGEQIQLQLTTKELYGPMILFMSNNNMFGFYGFIWVSEVLSAIIACDRCFCIMRPLRSQNLIRTSTVTVIIVILYIVIVGLFFIVATRYRITCSYDPLSDTSMQIFVPSEFYYQHQLLINCLDIVVFGAALPGIVIVVVVTATVITTVKLRQAASWRSETSSGGLSQAEIALTRMLVYNSTFFISCVVPMASFRFFFFAIPEMNPSRRQHNFHMMFKWIIVVISYINATFNFVVYYTMGSRYRQTFWQLFGRKPESKTSSASGTSSTSSLQ